MNIYTQTYLMCPWCEQQSGCRIDHLFDQPGRNFGPWECGNCKHWFSGIAISHTDITLKKEGRKPNGRALALLKIDTKDGPLYFVMEGLHLDPNEPDEEFQSHQQYFYEEHSCPSNWLRDCTTVISDGDMDPHGIMTHIRSVSIPLDFDPDDDDQVRNLFPECFPETIDHRQSLPPGQN